MAVAITSPTSDEESDAVEDSELVARALEGDLDAYDEIVRRYQSVITGLLYKFCPHRSDLEDLVQESLVKAFKNLHKWKATASFGSWLKKIAINTGYDYFRRNKRQPVALAGYEDNETILSIIPENSKELQTRNYTEEIQALLASLSADDRTLLTLQYLEGLQLAEIAEKMGWGLSKTKVKSFRAKKKLQTKLAEYGITEI